MNARLVALSVLAMTTVVGGQQPPNFRTEISFVELPVRVLDGKGNFVRDLGRADFQVFEDGKPQTIAEFTLVDLPLPARGAPLRNTAAEGVLSPLASAVPFEIAGR